MDRGDILKFVPTKNILFLYELLPKIVTTGADKTTRSKGRVLGTGKFADPL